MPARKGEAWNDEDVALLRALALAGCTIVTIALRLERTREAVSTKARLLNLKIAS